MTPHTPCICSLTHNNIEGLICFNKWNIIYGFEYNFQIVFTMLIFSFFTRSLFFSFWMEKLKFIMKSNRLGRTNVHYFFFYYYFAISNINEWIKKYRNIFSVCELIFLFFAVEFYKHQESPDHYSAYAHLIHIFPY